MSQSRATIFEVVLMEMMQICLTKQTKMAAKI